MNFFADSFITLKFSWVSFFMFPFWFQVLFALPILLQRLTFQGGYSRWPLIFLVYFYPWCVLLPKYRTSAVFLCIQWFSLVLLSVPLFLDTMRCVCFLIKLWNSGDHEICAWLIGKWIDQYNWSALFEYPFLRRYDENGQGCQHLLLITVFSFGSWRMLSLLICDVA